MPYRRLPNTDQARIRALKAVVVKGDICNVYDLAVSLKALTDARNFLTKFEAAQAYYADCFERQARAGRKHQANVKTARLYISHFIQVLNLAVIRSEVRIAHKEYYGLDTSNNNVPDLSTEPALAEWGRKIVDGENKRISLASMRAEADGLILDIWNQVEKKFEEVTPNEKRLDLCRDYGIIYYYRTGEKRKE